MEGARVTQIIALIHETRQWRKEHKLAGRQIEAAACAIREKALSDALKAIGGTLPPKEAA
jgi:glycerol dehydrogenase-like iron-containing ADH family enzyme